MQKMLIFFIILFSAAVAVAHSSSESFVSLESNKNQLTGYWQVSVSDLELALGIDADSNGKVTWGELNGRKTALLTYLQSGIQVLQNKQPCPVIVNDILIERKSRGMFAHFPLTITCNDTINILQFKYNLLFAKDAQHHIVWSVSNGSKYLTGVASSSRYLHQLDLNNAGWVSGFYDFLLHGIWHIWIGIDHILFVLLLLFCIEKSLHKNIEKQNTKKTGIQRIIKTITAFTVAHSITLTLAVMEWVSPDSVWIESVIALSVVLTGLNYIYGWVKEKLWPFAFGFGLIHGFGFASALLDLGLSSSNIAINLAAFNIGVEIGQLVIILVFLPVIIFIGYYTQYTKRIMQFSTWGIVILASVWFVERLAL